MSPVFLTGGTGYIGSRLIPVLTQKGFDVRPIIRPGSELRLPPETTPVVCSPLEGDTFLPSLVPGSTFVQLLGVPHPSPSKAAMFRQVDLVSVRESVSAAKRAGVGHFIYVSVAHPAPAMHAFVRIRMEGEELVRASGMNATILRPWYVLGPGHRWPYALIPLYLVCEMIPATREGARRLGLVTIARMVASLAGAVANPAQGVRIVDVEAIRRTGLLT